MAGPRKKLSRLSFPSRLAVSSSQWSSTPSPEFITMTQRSKSSNRCQRLHPTNSQRLPSSPRSTARKLLSTPCWKTRKPLCDTRQLVGEIFSSFCLFYPSCWIAAWLPMINFLLMKEKFINKIPFRHSKPCPLPSSSFQERHLKKTLTDSNDEKANENVSVSTRWDDGDRFALS